MYFKDRFISLLKLPYLPLIISPILLVAPLLFSGKVLFWGTPSLQFVPWWVWSFDSILSGRLPLWNQLVGMGAPLIANYQSALFYPPNWLYFMSYIIGDIPFLAWTQGILLAAHLIWACMGMAVLTKRLGLSRLAQTVSGLAFGLSGYLVARAWFASINASIAWLPWIMVCTFDMIQDENRLKSVMKLGLVTGMQLLAGHAQTSWYTWLLAIAWYGFWSFRCQRTSKWGFWQRMRSLGLDWGLFGLGILIGVGIASVQLIPTMEYLFHSQRASAVEFEAAMTYSMWPWRLLGLLAPNLFGNPANGNYWGYGNFWEDAIYVGIVPLLLAISVFLRVILRRINQEFRIYRIGNGNPPPYPNKSENGSKKEKNQCDFQSLSIFLLILLLVSFIFALGKNTPVFPWLYNHVPTFNLFQSPTRFSIWLVFSLSIASGIGTDLWRRPVERGLYWTRLGTAAAFAVILGSGLGWLFLKDVVPNFKSTFVVSLAFAGLWGMGAGILALTAPENKPKVVKGNTSWRWGLIIWICLDLISAGWGLNPGIDKKFYTEPSDSIAVVRNMVGDGRVYLLPDDEYALKYEVFFRFDSFNSITDWDNLRATLLPNINMLDKIPYANNYDPLVPGYYAIWMEKLQTVNTRIRDDLLDFMGVSVLEWQSESGEYDVRFSERDGAARGRWVPCHLSVADENEALDMIFSGKVNLRTEVVLETENSNWNQACYIPDFSPEMLLDTGNMVVMRIGTPTKGWLVLADIWYPGWRARIDGEWVKIYKANYAFRALEIPPGRHDVVFVYQPISFYLGSIISLLTFSSLGWFMFTKRKRGKRISEIQ